MSNGDSKILALVESFLQRQKLDFGKEDGQHCTLFRVQTGAHKATVNVYNTGKIVGGGPDSKLKTLFQDMKGALEAGEVGVGQTLPFEIEKFPQTIRERVSECDPVIIVFVEEVIKCLKHEALLGAAFMIGAASERAVNLLIHTYANSIQDDGNKAKFVSRIGSKSISKKYDEFSASFQFCRITRNEVGHPQIVPDLEKSVLIANIGNFVNYIERIYKLMKHLNDNGVVV